MNEETSAKAGNLIRIASAHDTKRCSERQEIERNEEYGLPENREKNSELPDCEPEKQRTQENNRGQKPARPYR